MKETYSLAEFCIAFQISKPTLYKLLASNNGPQTYMVGTRRYISGEAARAWQKKSEEDFKAQEIAPNTSRMQKKIAAANA